jgi:hypothetical protein
MAGLAIEAKGMPLALVIVPWKPLSCTQSEYDSDARIGTGGQS